MYPSKNVVIKKLNFYLSFHMEKVMRTKTAISFQFSDIFTYFLVQVHVKICQLSRIINIIFSVRAFYWKSPPIFISIPRYILLFLRIFAGQVKQCVAARRAAVFSVMAPLHLFINRYFAAGNFELVNVHFLFPPRGRPDDLTLHAATNTGTSEHYFCAPRFIPCQAGRSPAALLRNDSRHE